MLRSAGWARRRDHPHFSRRETLLASATAYEIAPAELFALFREIRAAGLECTGIYHSHPRGDNAPSSTDLKRAYYPDAAYFIVSPLPDAAKPVRAFRIRTAASPKWKYRSSNSDAHERAAQQDISTLVVKLIRAAWRPREAIFAGNLDRAG